MKVLTKRFTLLVLTQPGRIYGLPKMHKFTENDSIPKFRPIVSSIGTYNYNLENFLCNLLSPHIPSEYCSQNIHRTFVKEINQVSFENKCLVSFDVTSLFTNIPLQETLEIAVELIFEKNPHLKISKSDLKDTVTL